MRKKWLMITASALVMGSVSASAAPLFPDLPEDHWAKQAVTELTAKGVIKGYPDGKFRGNRAATRYEMAMLVAEVMAEMERQGSSFATKGDLEELARLVEEFKPELEALGARMDLLEEDVSMLNDRVAELERVTFYGYVDTVASFQSFSNKGLVAMESALPGGVGFVNIDYGRAVGTTAGAGGLLAPVSGAPATGAIYPYGAGPVVPVWNPFVTGVLTTTNWRIGRPLISGTGFSTRGVLGVNVNLSDDFEGGMEFSAYSSQGDSVIDAFYGVQQPYLSNPWTANSLVGGASASHQPYTKMSLDKAWIRHIPSGTKAIVGSFSEQDFSPSVFSGLRNPNSQGTHYLDNYGFLIDGRWAFDMMETSYLKWQVMGTFLPDGNTGSSTPGSLGANSSYSSRALGANIGWHFADERGLAKLNFLHAGNDALNGNALQVGLLQAANSSLGWVNPNGYYIAQATDPALVAGLGSTSDTRPTPMEPLLGNDGSVSHLVSAGLLPQGLPNLGGIGPQEQLTWGIEGAYEFDHKWSPKIYGEWSHSTYQPNKISNYSVDGDALRLGVKASLFNSVLDVDLNYMKIDPTYSPFIMPIPQVGGISTPLWTIPGFTYINSLYSLHDNEKLPHNREGINVDLTWKFASTGRVNVWYGKYDQTQSSMQDVRFSPNSLGAGTPNTPVLGFSPGFIDPVFTGFHPLTFASDGTNAFANPRENPVGTVDKLHLSGGYKWMTDPENSNKGLLFTFGSRWNQFTRETDIYNLAVADGIPANLAAVAENKNYVDLMFFGWRAGLDYDLTEDFTVKIGYTNVDVEGHLDPLGATSLFASSIGNGRFRNVDVKQTIPDIGFDWDIAENTTWNMTAKFFNHKDQVPGTLFVNPSLPAFNFDNGPQTAHPFNWDGVQVTTQFKVKF